MTAKVMGRTLFLSNGFASLTDSPETFRAINTETLFVMSARRLAERHGVTARTVARWRALVRKARSGGGK